MASFNISKGLEASLPSTKTDGKMYFCTDTGNIYIDYKDGNNILRKLVNKQILDAKQDAITGAASTIANSNLTASMVLISNSSGKVATSTITNTELNYLDGATSNIQTQINTLSSEVAYINESSNEDVEDPNAIPRITIDSELLQYSTNPVENQVVTAKFNAVDNAIGALQNQMNTLSKETWTFTLEDGTTITKAVYVG